MLCTTSGGRRCRHDVASKVLEPGPPDFSQRWNKVTSFGIYRERKKVEGQSKCPRQESATGWRLHKEHLLVLTGINFWETQITTRYTLDLAGTGLNA